MSKVFFGTCCLAILFGLITSFVQPGIMLQNSPPEVTITEPSENYQFTWNALIRYNISIKDKEDGNSEYDEINAKDVLLETCYLADEASARAYINKRKIEKENPGLTLIRRSDCFNCHASKTKLIGPSFDMIAKKYQLVDSTMQRLSKNVINGSSGVWGNIAMPAHNAMNENDVKEMVRWILNNGAAPDRAFYPGIQGAFKTAEKPGKGPAMNVLVLTASYADRGDNEARDNSMFGQHSILLKSTK